MKIKFLGALNEVGASGIAIKTNDKIFILDYGIKPTEKEPIFPAQIQNYDAIFLSHAHLDHCGAIPLLIKQKEVPIFSLKINKEISELLILDTIKIAKEENYELPYSKKHVERTIKNFHFVDYNEVLIFDDVEIRFFDAGHIPGSAMLYFKTSKNSILYTGDFNTLDTRLIKGCEKNLPTPKILITECTYSYTDHPKREEEEKKFVEKIKETLENNGIALISAFAVSRAQEIILILYEYLKKKIYLDGMAKDVTKIYLKYKKLLKDKKTFRKAIKKVKFVENEKERREIIKKPNIIISPSGMLRGGAIIDYIKKLYKDENSTLFLTGFQAPDTPGRKLLESGKFIDEKENICLDLKMKYEKFDFSSHVGRSDLINFIKKLNPEIIFCIHGDYAKEFASELKELGFKAFAPSLKNNIFKLNFS